jgi:hypothetical protein
MRFSQDPSLAKTIAQCWSKSAASRPTVAQLIATSQALARAGGGPAHKEHKVCFFLSVCVFSNFLQPALFEPNDKYVEAAPAKSAADESLDDMLKDLDKML